MREDAIHSSTTDTHVLDGCDCRSDNMLPVLTRWRLWKDVKDAPCELSEYEQQREENVARNEAHQEFVKLVDIEIV